MWKKILIGVVVVVGGFLAYVAALPSYSVFSREIVINASAEKVFPYVSTRSIANSWNPWLRMDKKAKITLNGPEVGVGSQTAWSEGEQLGTGSATVTEVVPNEKVAIRLEYVEPFAMVQTASILLKPVGQQTTVTWQVEGESSFFHRMMCVFMNMDKMVGDVFTQGLGELKTMVEATK